MANKVLQRPKVQENLNRNAFDRSFLRNKNQSAGMIVPVMAEPCIAGTKGVINRKVFTRSAQVVSPAFPVVDQCFDFFKVPIRYLMSSWNDWKLNINDIGSSAILNSLSTGKPDLSLNASLPYINFGNDSGSFPYRVDDAISTYLPSVTLQNRVIFLNNLKRLYEGLGYGTMGAYIQSVSDQANAKNIFKICAYQKVYFDHYRNTSYESNNPFAYNIDDLYRKGTSKWDFTSDIYEIQRFMDMWTLRYVNYRNDFYKNIYPSLNYVSSVPIGNDFIIPSNVVGASSSYSSDSFRVFNRPASGSAVLGQQSVNLTSSNQFISAQSIRAMFALDKLARASAYTPKHVRDQFKARFGIDVGEEVSHESERLGSFKNSIVFGEVTNVAESSSSALGEVGGKGIGASDFDKDIHFYCEEDSIILGVCYFIPRACYDLQPDEWNNYLTRESFFQPEFQNLGLRPMQNDYGIIFGYTVPNQRYKLGADFNEGLFKTTDFRYNISGTSVAHTVQPGALRTFSVHSQPVYGLDAAASADYFKVKPSDLDAIFATSYSNEGSMLTDQFFYNVVIKFAVTQNMSVHGQPSL